MSTNDWEVICQIPDTTSSPGTFAIRNLKDPTISHPIVLCKIHGTPCFSSTTQDRWTELDTKVQYRDSDIIVATYPKCGTTWIEQCILLLLNRGDANGLNPAVKNVYVPGSGHIGKIWIEPSVDQGPEAEMKMGMEGKNLPLADFNDAPAPRVIKSHAPTHLLVGGHTQGIDGLNAQPKIVVVTRNPLDACVSAYYHAWNPYKCGWSFEAWASIWYKGMVATGSWYDWVKGWYGAKQAHSDRILWIQYEDVQANPAAVITSLALFCNIEYDDEIIAKVVSCSSFDSMKEQAMGQGGDAFGHLRQGKSGDWKNHFTPTLYGEFQSKYESELAGTGLKYSLGSSGEEFVAST